VALGESLVAIGVGITALPISWPIIVASFLGVTVAAALWWAYFDVVSIAAERVLARARDAERAALDRDSYTYLHLPMVTGIILLALYGGVIRYLLGHVGFRLRNMRSVNRPRVATTVLLGLFLPVADHLPALAALGLLAAVCAGMVVTEMALFGEARRALRDEFLAEHGAGGPPGR
jgi:hypothetical protein